MDTSHGEGGSLLKLDSNLVACVLLHLQPADLAKVAQTCSELARETDADVVWCTLFLRRFGSDFWGEATPGPHPYTAVPPEHNEWLGQITDLFARFSLKCQHHREKPTAAAVDGDEEEDESQDLIENRLMEFVRSHATTDAGGYGGWKAAYRRMHDMVTEWRKPVNAAYIVAGLPAFSTLSAIIDIIKQGALEGFPCSQLTPQFIAHISRLEADMVSPGGQCRVIRMTFTSPNEWKIPVERIANICVIRKPRNWYHAGENVMFRGLKFGQQLGHRRELIPKLIYVVDGERMERNEHYQELVYRELHGALGEGKDHFESGLAVNLYLLNTTAPSAIIDRLKVQVASLVRPYALPNHMCPYYAGRVYFLVAGLHMRKDCDADDESTKESPAEETKRAVVNSFRWLSQQPSSRPHWNTEPFLLCTLTSD